MEIETLEQKVSYIFGREIAQELAKKSFPKMNIKIVQEAIMDTFMQKEWPFDPSDAESLKAEMEERRKAAATELKQKQIEFEQTFFEKNGQRDEVIIHSSGIQYEILVEGTDEIAASADTQFLMRHKTWLLNGRQVDGSIHLPAPISVSLHQAPVSWLIALKQMKLGATWRLYVPGHLAYKEDEHPRIPEETAVIFDLHVESTQ
ncbi:FKBP-type peptidyl-prolyl cis-trans isomerase N-terminal domain-containing protein [Vibrio hangzhouensis]|uniref:FKBP-type peptidyl-prolyl cis-trans isomerase N-terminal domain-containing protein n=1 Tax=Vibrio hangzhouensis TaxID=462991 RepID=UPI001C97DF91|nr:FKBP-type peptidyl-prolyl cis-trans isomerase N-terminal domain-containing protein [Vibrio hangzhouensis]MBY6196816.1 FKBP-type peptidyl-prolyl cis-trans isomerase [Vibrio hangzhouensis]